MKKAYENREIHFNKYDSVFSEQKINQINELEIQYQTEKKEAALALQEEEIKTLNEKAKNDKLKKGLYAGGMASALALFAISVFGSFNALKRTVLKGKSKRKYTNRKLNTRKRNWPAKPYIWSKKANLSLN